MPHFTQRRRSGNVLAASASTASAMPRCGCGRRAMYAKTGLSPTAAFAGLALPVIASGSAVATSTCAAVRVAGFWTSLLPISLLVTESIIWCHREKVLTLQTQHPNAPSLEEEQHEQKEARLVVTRGTSRDERDPHRAPTGSLRQGGRG